MKNTPTVGDSQHPHVIGMDVPALEPDQDPHKPHIMTALLDVTPAREWAAILTDELAAFRREHRLTDVRLVGPHLTLIGPHDALRRLVGEVHALVHHVSRLCMHDRITGRRRVVAPPQIQTVVQPSVEAAAVLDEARQRDVDAVAGIASVTSVLEAVTRQTGMRFAAVARVTEHRWTACAVYDLIEFGLQPGQDLVLETTICNEIRQHGQSVSFGRASTHRVFSDHPTPSRYGFESYISVPIRLPDGRFFGTLCAIDPDPARLDERTVRTLEQFAAMIGHQLALEGVVLLPN